MPKTPRFSIVTITFNAAHTLERTLRSIMSQSYQHIEYIVIDGQSKDGTLDLIRQYEKYITHWISEPDKGLYDAMNKGIAHCTGDYICFLNAGDTFASTETLAYLSHAIRHSSIQPDVVYGDTILVDDDGHIVGMRQHQPPRHLTWKSFRLGMLVCHQAFFARRDLVVPYDLNYRFSADYDWCIRILKKSRQTLHTNQPLIHYLNEGVTTRNHRASLRERFHIMEKHYGRITTWVLHLWFIVRAIVYKIAPRKR